MNLIVDCCFCVSPMTRTTMFWCSDEIRVSVYDGKCQVTLWKSILDKSQETKMMLSSLSAVSLVLPATSIRSHPLHLSTFYVVSRNFVAIPTRSYRPVEEYCLLLVEQAVSFFTASRVLDGNWVFCLYRLTGADFGRNFFLDARVTRFVSAPPSRLSVALIPNGYGDDCYFRRMFS